MLAHVVLAVSALAAPRPTSGASISTYLAPVDEEVLGEEFSAAKVETTTLRDRLRRRTALRLVDGPEHGGMRVQVTGCARVQAPTVKRDPQRHPPVTLPMGHGTTMIREEEHGVSVENRTFVVLSVRLVWQDETREIASGEADLSLEAAASMVARELEKLAKRKGR